MPQLIQIHPMGADKPTVVQLHPSADVQQLAQQFEAAAATDGVVTVEAVLPSQIESTTLYVRPKACALWGFVEMTDEELARTPTGNWLVDLMRTAAEQQQRDKGLGGP